MALAKLVAERVAAAAERVVRVEVAEREPSSESHRRPVNWQRP